ncbi:hypothetical protein L1049_015283 [Liquidambar formosana]|uniref:GH10 domain-containing protein n=1 Tax=Liquidambar formosana TaxID=63359 RepID=A0AAP0S4I0_LIQFO
MIPAVTYANKTAMKGARVSIKHTKPGFLLGCAMNKNILDSTAYQNWFTSRFTVTTFGNEMKWYSTEKKPGQENYTASDAMSYFSTAYKLDPRTTMFMNEFNTIEYSGDSAATPYKYAQKIGEILSFPGNDGLLAGIGLQSHFSFNQPNIPYMRASLDFLGATGLPIWLTEVDVKRSPNQDTIITRFLHSTWRRYSGRVRYSHPAVQGIVIWSGPAVDGCAFMCLTDINFKNTPIGDVVDKLIGEWRSGTLEITADSTGSFKTSLFHGDYDLTVIHPVTNSSTTLSFKVAADIPQQSVPVQGELVTIVVLWRNEEFHRNLHLIAFMHFAVFSGGSETVAVVFRTTSGGLIQGGTVMAEHGCWSMLKGGIVANFSGPVDILFKCYNTGVEIWADNFSLQPFTKKQWRSHQDKSIDKVRKSKVRFQVTYANKTAMDGARISIKQTKSDFPLGCGMTKNILKSTTYQNCFGQPNIPFMRASLDILGATGLPLWLTEVDVKKSPDQAQYLEEILREGYSHPAVQGMVLWSGPAVDGCSVMCLTDEKFENTPIGDVVDKLIGEWRSGTLEIAADNIGSFETSLFHGDYDLTAIHPVTNSSIALSFKVAVDHPQETVHVQIHA